MLMNMQRKAGWLKNGVCVWGGGSGIMNNTLRRLVGAFVFTYECGLKSPRLCSKKHTQWTVDVHSWNDSGRGGTG